MNLKFILYLGIQISCFIAFTQPALHEEWGISFGNSSGNSYIDVTVDADYNMIGVGHFGGTIDMQPGSGITNLVSGGGQDVFIQKLDSNGNFIWAKKFSGASTEWVSAVCVDTYGNVIVGGSLTATCDFDPGAGVFNMSPVGSDDAFLVKLDPSGNFLWAKSFSGSGESYLWALDSDGANNIFIAGGFDTSCDFDPGPGTQTLSSSGSTDIYVCKLDENGTYVWAKSYGIGTHPEEVKDCRVDSNGDVIVLGKFYNTVDFDPGAGVLNLTANPGNDVFVQKLDVNGNLLWATAYGNSVNDMVFQIDLDSNQDIYIAGELEGTVDFDPGPGAFSFSSNSGSKDGYVYKLGSNGSPIWVSTLGSVGEDFFTGLCVNADNEVAVTGSTYVYPDYLANGVVYPWVGVLANHAIIGKFDVNGNFIFARSFGGSNSGGKLLDVGNDNLLNVMSFSGTVDLAPGPQVHTFVSMGSTDFFIQRLSVCPAADTIVFVEGCDLVVYNGQNISTSGTYFQNILGLSGCDSLIETVVTVKNSTDSIFSIQTCDDYTLNGITYTTDGSYTQLLTNAVGCDSTITINITNYDSDTTLNVTSCVPYDLNGTIYEFTGNYTQLLTNGNIFGCDSTIYLNLTGPYEIVLPEYTIGDNDSIMVFGNYVESAGFYYDSLSTISGCDSVFVQEVIIDPAMSCGFSPTPQVVEWEMEIGADHMYDIVHDDANNMYLLSQAAGYFEGLNTTITVGSPGNMFLGKFDSSGNALWARNFGGFGLLSYQYISIDQDANIIIGGSLPNNMNMDPGVSNFTLTGDGIYVAKYDSSGNFIWAKKIVCNVSSNYPTGIAVDGSNNIYMTGDFYDNVDFDPGAGIYTFGGTGYRQFVLKLDSSGNFKWANEFIGGAQTNAIRVDNNSNVLVTGSFSYGTVDFLSGPGVVALSTDQSDYFTVKMDSLGNLMWVKKVGGQEMDIDVQNNIILLGVTSDTIDLDPGIGEQLYSELAGYGIYVLKLGEAGNYLWEQHFYSNLEEDKDMEVDDYGNIHLSLMTGLAQVDIDPEPGVFMDNGPMSNFTLNQNGCLVKTYDFPSGGFKVIHADDAGSFYGTWIMSGFTWIRKLGNCATPVFNTISETVCAEYISPSGNYIWTASGTYSDTISSYLGCDSIITINLTILPVSDSTINATVCASFTLNSILYSVTGIHQQVLTGINGCDSILTLNLTIDPAYGNTDTSYNQAGSIISATEFTADFQWLDCSNAYVIIPGETAQTFTPDTLCTVAFEITLNGCIDTSSCITITADDFYNTPGYVPLYSEVFPLPISEMGECDGEALAIDWGGGVPPYTRHWSNDPGNVNLGTLDSACYGIHTYKIVDNIGDSLKIPFFITDSINYYNWYTAGLVVDTLYLNAENCLLDYNLPIDSVSLSQFYFYTPDPYGWGDLYIAEVSYYQAGVNYLYQDTLLVQSPGDQLVMFAIWCPSKSLSTIKIVNFSFGFPDVLGIEDQQQSGAPVIYPNPNTGLFYIKNANYDNVVVYDLTGREVYNSVGFEETVDVTGITPGIYQVVLMHEGALIHIEKIVITD
jgi:hypothetical protein